MHGALKTKLDIAHFVAMPGHKIFLPLEFIIPELRLPKLDDKRSFLTDTSMKQGKMHNLGTGLQTCELNVLSVLQERLVQHLHCLQKILAIGVPHTDG